MQKRHVGGPEVKNLTHKNQITCSAQGLPNNAPHCVYCAVFSLLRAILKTTLSTINRVHYSAFRLLVALIAIIAIAFSLLCAQSAQNIGLVQEARADTTHSNEYASHAASDLKNRQQKYYYDDFHSKGIELSIKQATPVVTDKSGYHLTVTLKSETPLPEGTVRLSINSNYTFVSRTDLQNWAQGESLIPTPQILGSVKTAKLSAGDTSTIRFDLPADNPELQNIWNWGPKPLKITYFSDDYSRRKSILSFFTRSNDGMHIPNLPAMKLTALMPILANNQHVLKSDIKKHHQHNNDLLQISKSETHHILEQANLVSKHAKLQTIADINSLHAARSPLKPNAYMQKSGFDISAYADDKNPNAYLSAGINEKSWSYSNSQDTQNVQTLQPAQISQNTQNTQNPTNQNEAKQSTQSKHNPIQSFAWQTYGKWTISALEQAKRNGYNTVIATDEFDSDSSKFAISDGVYDINTPAGNVRVLTPQEVLTTLANGNPTSFNAISERTQAGRINRLVAQSAFYQMEQPYVDRHILITFSNKTDISNIDSIMNALEQSNWLSLSDLSSMTKIKQDDTLPYWRRNSILRAMPHSSGISAATAKIRRSTLNNLSKRRKDVLYFTHNIVDHSKAIHLRNTEGDAQALAKQTIKSKSKINSKSWCEYLLKLYDNIALHELINNTSSQLNDSSKDNSSKDNSTKDNSPKVEAGNSNKNTQPNDQNPAENNSENFVSTMLSGIRIIPPRDITAVSETASMPITISNAYQYPVKVYLSADTHAMEIVTRRKTLVSIPANSETQITLPLRITTSLHTKATFVLEDNQNHAFSKPEYTLITSTLQISDKSGTIIIIFAFMLGLLGLWRQFHRKKDPDE